jgi:UDP-2,4-diacetamido-2,4,6-trideoxy-beta-L-altropyranose hydrolase
MTLMSSKPKVYFRADGNAQMGLGHVFRSLALAEMLSESFDCHFVIRNPLASLKPHILAVCKSIIELPKTDNSTAETAPLLSIINKNEIIVLDGYHFQTDYQNAFKNRGIKVVCIDDIYEHHFTADVVINHAGGIEKTHYLAEKYTQFYLGLQYALLRKPFREIAKNKVEKPNNLFICLGGADPKNDTLNILKKVEKTGEQNTCFLVVGGAYLHQKSLNQFLENTTLKVNLLSNLSADEMVFYMNQCARAITPPSTVSYEYLSTGGLLYLKVIADNQININRYFLNDNLALSFEDDFGYYSTEKIELCLKNQSNLFDGNQQKRFLNVFHDLAITTRLANSDDCKLYFDWTNEPLTRQQSFNSEPILFEYHEAWFNRRLADENSVLFVVEFNKNPIGQIRFQIEKNTATISYSLDENYRGKGLGFWILKKGVDALRNNLYNTFPNLEIIGFVKYENIASVKVFRKLGFRETTATEIENSYKYFIKY